MNVGTLSPIPLAAGTILGLSACATAASLDAGAGMVRLERAEPSATEWILVGAVRCERGTAAESLEANASACRAELRNKAVRLDADLVWIRQEALGTVGCPSCVVVHGEAFRRQVPWSHGVPVQPTARTAGAAVSFTRAAAEIATGTGFAVHPSGLILTAHHVIEGARTISLTFPDGGEMDATVETSRAQVDLALLRASGPTPGYLPLAAPDSAEIGARVWTLGFPAVDLLGSEPKFTDGSISALSGPGGAAEVFQVTVPIQPGNSGGPLLDEQGRVVGVITATAAAIPFFRRTGTLPQGINYAVKIDLGRQLFEAPATLPAAVTRSEAVSRARKAICYVEVISGDGLVPAPRGFGRGFESHRLRAFAVHRDRCDAGDAESCLAVAHVVVAECDAGTPKACSYARVARTLLRHACNVGHADACKILRAHAGASPR